MESRGLCEAEGECWGLVQDAEGGPLCRGDIARCQGTAKRLVLGREGEVRGGREVQPGQGPTDHHGGIRVRRGPRQGSEQ